MISLTRAIELLVDPGKTPWGPAFRGACAPPSKRKPENKKRCGCLANCSAMRLGRRLYIAYLQSRISRKEIHALFHDPLNTPNRPLECYRELTLRYCRFAVALGRLPCHVIANS